MLKQLTFMLVLLGACGPKGEPEPDPVIPGGKGGDYNVAVFPVKGKIGITCKCYIKYGCKDIPGGTVSYNDSIATMTEPGFGPHAHFMSLQPGFYLVSAKGTYASQPIQGDTIIEVKKGQAYSTDFNLGMK